MCAMLLASCMQEIFNPEAPGPGTEPDDEHVTLDISAYLMDEPGMAVWTKSLGEAPQVKDLYVAVFDGGDILTEIVKAEPGTIDDPRDEFQANAGDHYLTRFHVTLKRTSEPREIQFIAIGQKNFIDVDAFDMVDEASFIKQFIVSDNVDAYWCRKHFAGINQNSGAQMQRLKMIRNFLKVTVSSVAADFELQGFYVFNKPRYGTLAPYNPNTDEYLYDNDGASVNFDRFANYARIEGNEEDDDNEAYKELVETQKYYGYMPSTVEYISMREEVGADNPEDWFTAHMLTTGQYDYLYECTYTEAANPFIIFKGIWDSDPETAGIQGHPTYYKADFVYHESEDAEKVYFHLLRNFFYELKINYVANDGAETLEAAVNSPSMNNFDGSSESHTYTVISKTGARMYISATDILVTNGIQAKVYLKNLTGANFDVNSNNDIFISKITKCINVKDVNKSERATPLIQYVNPGGYTSDDAAYQAAIGADDFDPADSDYIGNYNIVKTSSNAPFNGSSGWVEYTITLSKNPNTLGDNEMWQQEITFSDGEGGLTRTLVLSGRKPYEFSIDVQDYVPGNAGEQLTVDITIPSGISEARFPLRFLIESNDHTIYPDATSADYAILPVTSGSSQIPNKSERSYWFTRTITYEEYMAAAEDIQSNKTFTSYFKTLVPASATSVYVMSAAETSSFFSGVENDSFVNERIRGSISFEKEPLNVEVGGKAFNPVTVNSGAPVTYSVQNVAVATVNASTGEVIGVSEGTTVVTATIPEYKAYTGASAQFTVKVVKRLPEWSFSWDGLLTPVVNRGKTVATNTATAVARTSSSTYNRTVKYYSSDPLIASVDSLSGVVTGVAPGVVTITATAGITHEDYSAADQNTYSPLSESLSYTIEVVAPGVSPNLGTEYIDVPFTDGSLLWFSKTYTNFDSWYFRSDGLQYGIQASAWDYDGDCSRDSDSWLISPVMDLRAAVNPVLEFNHTGNWWTDGYTGDGTYGEDGEVYVPALSEAAGTLDQAKGRMMQDALVLISFDGGAWSSVGLTELEYPSGYNWTSVDVSHSLKPVLQGKTEAQLQNVRIAFEYRASPETKPSDPHNYRPWAGTWQIKNFRIVELAE